MSRCSTKRVSWEEWKQRCAIGNCDAEARDDLGKYGGKVIAGLWRKFSGNLSDPFGSHRDRWHLFESYMHACSTRTGKRWKDWLFEKASGSTDDFVLVLEKEAYECMDTTVRKYCRAESHRKARLAGVWITSSDEPMSNDSDSTRTYGDLFAGNPWEQPEQLAAWNELRDIAQTEAEKLFSTLDQADKTVLLANRLGLSLGEAAVEKVAGKKKTALYERLKQIGARNRERLLEKYSSEDVRTLEALVSLAGEALDEAGFCWGRTENSAAPIFALLSTRTNP